MEQKNNIPNSKEQKNEDVEDFYYEEEEQAYRIPARKQWGKRIRNEFSGLIDPIMKKISSFSTNKPKLAFGIMFGFLVLNIAALFIYYRLHPNNDQAHFNFMNMKDTAQRSDIDNLMNQDDIGLIDLYHAKQIRDKMRDIISKGHLTKQDSIDFVRLNDEFIKIAPKFNKSMDSIEQAAMQAAPQNSITPDQINSLNDLSGQINQSLK